MKVSAASSTNRLPRSPSNCVTPPPDRARLEGPSRPLDPRIHAYRRDVADIALAGRLFAPHYARPETCHLTVASEMLRADPSSGARAVSQLLHGEGFAVLDITGGWAWGRCLHDDYVGYLPAEVLGRVDPPSHRVTAPLALIFTEADIKSPVVAHWPFGSLVGGKADGAFVATSEGYVHSAHLAPADERATDPVAAAEALLGQPYLWGGRGAGGVDCSGLVQIALGMAGLDCPRDTDLQRDALGEALGDDATLQRGDLIFFPGHVGLMADPDRLLHANAHWMAVTIEPLADVVARGPAISARRRLP